MCSRPIVSVIIIFLNSERFIQEAIESVFAQTYDNWELLLIDDGSTDAGANIAKRYVEQYPEKLRYIEHENHRNLGMSVSRNLGIRHAKGEYIAFLDADDVWMPHKLEKQVEILDSNSDVAFVCGPALWWYGWTGNQEDMHCDFVQQLDVQLNTVVQPPELLVLFLQNEWASLCDILIRREVVEALGGYEESFRGMYEDQAFHAKLCFQSSGFVSSDCWYHYRQHQDACTSLSHKSGRHYAARLYFFNWLEDYLSKQGARETQVWQVLQNEMRSLRRPAFGHAIHMKNIVFDKIRCAAQWGRKKISSRGIILMYHRVAENDVDPWSLCVTPRHFAEHLEVLRKYATPVSLKQLAQTLHEGRIPKTAVAVTFDDGYASNLHNAKPLLDRYDIPATVFVSGGYLVKDREFWWDELDQVLLQPGRLPEKLYLKINDNTQKWELGAAVDYSETDHEVDRSIQARETRPSARLSFYFSVWEHLQPLLEAERRKALDQIIAWAHAEPIIRPIRRPLAPEEVWDLEQGGGIEVGAHTVTHPLLSVHPVNIQRDEIKQNKTYLEEILGHSITSFSYPFGSYTKETIPLVRWAEFNCACSTMEETVWRHSDRFQLPRFGVDDCNGEQFKRWLVKCFKH